MKAEHRKQVQSIPGEDGFWKDSTKEKYEQAYVKLISLGMSSSDAVTLLTDLYHATSEEFGQ